MSKRADVPTFILVLVGCADERLDDLFHKMKLAAEALGGMMYRDRTPGAVFAMAFHPWITRLLAEPFIRKAEAFDCPILFLFQRHNDCAGENWTMGSWQNGEVWSGEQFDSMDALWQWAARQAITYLMGIESTHDLVALKEHAANDQADVFADLMQAMERMAAR